MPGTETTVRVLPECDIHRFHGVRGVSARYDAKTDMGPWAHLCPEHFNSLTSGELGVGKGQRLVLLSEVDLSLTKEIAWSIYHEADIRAAREALGPGATDEEVIARVESMEQPDNLPDPDGANTLPIPPGPWNDEQPEPVEPCDHVGAGIEQQCEGLLCKGCGALLPYPGPDNPLLPKED